MVCLNHWHSGEAKNASPHCQRDFVSFKGTQARAIGNSRISAHPASALMPFVVADWIFSQFVHSAVSLDVASRFYFARA
jgi:hypothetical protein